MAISKRKIDNNLIFHSDRGIQYASKEFRNQLNTNNLITQSTPSDSLGLEKVIVGIMQWLKVSLKHLKQN
jgi:hypothetical protein